VTDKINHSQYNTLCKRRRLAPCSGKLSYRETVSRIRFGAVSDLLIVMDAIRPRQLIPMVRQFPVEVRLRKALMVFLIPSVCFNVCSSQVLSWRC